MDNITTHHYSWEKPSASISINQVFYRWRWWKIYALLGICCQWITTSTKIWYKLQSGKFWPDPLSCFQEIRVPTGPSYETLWSSVSQTPWTYAFRLYPYCGKGMWVLHYFHTEIWVWCAMAEKTLSTITTSKLANLIVDCTDTIRAKKNWNSHGATLGLAICQISSIISSLGKASEEEVRPDFI